MRVAMRHGGRAPHVLSMPLTRPWVWRWWCVWLCVCACAAHSKCKPDWAKGYFRKGRAHEAAGQFEDASLAYWEAAKRDASVAVFRESFQRALKLAKEQYAKQNAEASAGAGSSEAKA